MKPKAGATGSQKPLGLAAAHFWALWLSLCFSPSLVPTCMLTAMIPTSRAPIKCQTLCRTRYIIFSRLSLTTALRGRAYYCTITMLNNLRLGEVQRPAQGHTDGKWESRDVSPGL